MSNLNLTDDDLSLIDMYIIDAFSDREIVECIGERVLLPFVEARRAGLANGTIESMFNEEQYMKELKLKPE